MTNANSITIHNDEDGNILGVSGRASGLAAFREQMRTLRGVL